MSTIFERLRMALGVVLAGTLLVLSTVAAHDWSRFLPPQTPAADVQAVRSAVALLQQGRAPLTGIQACEAAKSLLPDMFSRAQGETKMKQSTGDEVILCFRDSLEYGDALAAARQRGLNWTAGIGGDRIVVFAPSRERFLAVARRDGIPVRDGDLVDWSPMLHALRGQTHAHEEGRVWVIDPAPVQVEALFGPYLDLEPGAYRVALVLDGASPADCAAMAQERVGLAVTAEGRRKLLAPSTALALTRQAGPGCRYGGALSFVVAQGGARSVETPVWVQGFARMRLVGYSLGN
jgi:hypothetical protein